MVSEIPSVLPSCLHGIPWGQGCTMCGRQAGVVQLRVEPEEVRLLRRIAETLDRIDRNIDTIRLRQR